MTLEILTQYKDENGKPKGGTTFLFPNLPENFCWLTEDEKLEVIHSFVALNNTPDTCGTYTYLSHEICYLNSVDLVHASVLMELTTNYVNKKEISLP